MPVWLVVEGGPYAGVKRADVLRSARRMLGALQMEKLELSILLTGDDQIQILNRLYRNKNRPTDVLAFAQREGELAECAGRVLGDVVISVPTARRQAEARRVGLSSEVAMLLAHGLLHLVGWDHATAADDRRMRRETRRLCIAAQRTEAPPSGRDLKGPAAPPANGDSRPRKTRRTPR